MSRAHDSTSHEPSISEILLSVSACVVASGAGCGLMFKIRRDGCWYRCPYTGAWVDHFTRGDMSVGQPKDAHMQNPKLVLLFIFSLTLVLCKEFDEGAHFVGTADKDCQ
jgi:hypothetical protein